MGLDIARDRRPQHSTHVRFVVYAQLLELPMHRRGNEHGDLSVSAFSHRMVIWANWYLWVSVLPRPGIYTSAIIWVVGGIY